MNATPRQLPLGKIIKFGIPTVLVLATIIIGTLVYMGRIPQFVQQQKPEPTPPNMSSLFYLSATNQLTEEEIAHLQSDKTRYSIFVFEYSPTLQQDLLIKLQPKSPVYVLATSSDELQSPTIAAIKNVFVPDSILDECKTLEYTCFTYATTQEQVELPSTVPTTYSKTIQFRNREVFHTHYVFTCIQDDKCVETFVTSPPTTLLSANNTSFMLMRSDLKQLSPFITQLPKVEIEIKTEKIPIILWNMKDASGMFSQQAFSAGIKTLNSKEVLSKTGKITTGVTGDYFIPTTQPKENDFTYTLTVWYGLGESPIEKPIITEKTFSHTFTAPDLQTDSQGNVQYIAWIPDWGMARALESLRKNPKRWNTISPVWYFLKKDGTFTVERNVNNPELLRIAKNNGITVLPTITQFDPDILSETLNNHFDAHIKNIVDLVNKNGYIGIDLDYESTYLKDKALFEKFIETLSIELKKTNKILVFTVLAKWSDEKIYTFLPQTRQVQDWAFLSKHVDEIRIMGYDFTSQSSVVPGPLSPILWNDAILNYALTKVPPEKLVLALPLYSHGWPEPGVDPAGANNDQEISVAQKNTISLQHSDISGLRRTVRGYSESFDTWNSEVRSTFKDGKVNRIMFYLDKKAIQEREQLAKKYKIKGLAFWRMGGEEL
jgi:spore germination protein YaaH